MADDTNGDVVTWEAADRGAMCALGCVALVMILGGVALILWGAFAGGVWRVIVAVVCLLGAAGLIWYLNSPYRGRWEISFDPTHRVVQLYAREEGVESEREIPFDEIAEIRLREITRNVTMGNDVPHQLPVLVLRDGDELALDRRMSVRDPERAEEIVGQMRELVGLDEPEEQ